MNPVTLQSVNFVTVPRLLNDDQKERHLQVFQDIIERL